MPIKSVLIALVAILLSSCSSTSSKSNLAKQDLIQQYDSFYKATIGKIFDAEKVKKWVTFDTKVGKTRIEGVNEFRRLWCSSLDVKEMKRRTFNIATDYCYELGGNMRDRWCRSKEDKPLFYMVAGDRSLLDDSTIDNYCHPNRIFSLVVSTSEGATPEDWNNRVKKTYGYIPLLTVLEQEKQAKELREKALFNKQSEAESNATMIMVRGIGRRACKDVRPWTYSGIVNKIEGGNIQVLVDFKSAGGFQERLSTPIVTSDAANKWYPCDTTDERNLNR